MNIVSAPSMSAAIKHSKLFCVWLHCAMAGHDWRTLPSRLGRYYDEFEDEFVCCRCGKEDSSQQEHNAMQDFNKENRECKCSLRTKLVGDGCDVCNPAQALECAKDTIADLKEKVAALEKAEADKLAAVKRMQEAAIEACETLGASRWAVRALIRGLSADEIANPPEKNK